MRKLLILLALLCFLPMSAQAATVTATYADGGQPLLNPYIGCATWANNAKERQQPFTLVYANLRWADFEPEPGVYDFASFEEENHFTLWKEQGKHLIIRFVMDVPGSKKHLDIPQWLYEQTKDGKYYNVSYGRGYCPDYTNKTLIAAHRRAIAALGERYDSDPFVAYIELGSLGHWGEWHVHTNAGTMPAAAVRDAYASAYTDVFSNVKLMMRRPFRFTKTNGLGLYNDTSGDPDATETWLTWIAQGGVYNETGEEDALVSMQSSWQTAPIGGELATVLDIPTALGSELTQTLSLFTRSHTSWIGPGSFVYVEKDGAQQAGLNQLLSTLGYRLRVSAASVTLSDSSATLSFTWENSGNAPFYFGWTPAIRLQGDSTDAQIIPLSLDLLTVLPEAPKTVSLSLPATPGAAFTVSAGILDPQTGEPGVALAMDVPEDGGWYQLLTVTP